MLHGLDNFCQDRAGDVPDALHVVGSVVLFVTGVILVRAAQKRGA